MKKIILFFFLFSAFTTVLFGQVKKVAKPEFQVTSIKIICCGGGPSSMTKKIVHVVYNNAPAGTKIRIENMTGGLIGSYTLSGDDFKTPCLSLGNGISYSITYTDNAGLPFPITPTTLIAPTCGIKKPDLKVIDKKN